MPLVDMRDMLNHAHENGYAVGAFGLANFEFLEAIMQAAENCRAPVILNLSANYHDSHNLALVLPAVEAAAKRATVPVAIHYDHAPNQDAAIGAINLGSNGIMVASSTLPLDQNIILSKQVVAMAKGCGVAVEGDLGYMACEEENNIPLTTPAEARIYVERTGVDFLAVSIGNRHGHNRAKLDFTRLKQIHAAVQCPLVIHGGSGLTEDQLRRLVGYGVAKINYFTSLADIAADSIRNQLRLDKNADYATLKKDVKIVVCQEVERCMRIWGSAGRAAEVLKCCQAWLAIEHIIVYNIIPRTGLSAENLMHEGRKVLSTIPGVREVFTGQTVKTDSRYQLCWRIRFAHPNVIESYRNHPAHVQFANRHFRPVADDRLTIDYLEVV